MTKPGYKKTELGELPEEWDVVRLGDVASFKNGINFKKEQRGNKGVLIVDVLNMYGEGIEVSLDELYRVQLDLDKYSDFILKPGDILFVRSSLKREGAAWASLFTGYGESVTYCGFIIRARLKSNNKFYPPYLTYYLRLNSVRKRLISSSGQVTISNISQQNLKNLKLPLPPLPEQRRIAKVLSTVDAAIEATEEEIERTERLKRGLMQRLLTRGIGHEKFKDTEIGRIPEEWEVARLGNVVEKIMNGGTPSTKVSEYWSGNIPWIRSVNITTYYLDKSMVEKYITLKGLENSSTNIIPKGNIIIATRVGIGKSAVNLIDVAINQDLTGLIIDKNKVDPFFVVWYLHSSKVQKYLDSFSRGTTIKGIPQRNIKNLKLPLPPLEEQKKIAEILGTMDERLELLRARKERLERVKRGLMNDLLTGRKRVPEEVV